MSGGGGWREEDGEMKTGVVGVGGNSDVDWEDEMEKEEEQDGR